VPFPDCKPWNAEGIGACQQSRLNRNNYAIAAMNDWFESELRKLNYPGQQIVRAYDIIMPRLQYGLYLCDCHFLCRRDQSSSVAQTAEGVAIAMAIERALCVLV
jgi:hypothetical protein